MKMFGREIKISIQKCPECHKRNLVIDVQTKKWLKGKEYIFQGGIIERKEK